MSYNQKYQIYITGSGTGSFVTDLKKGKVILAVTDSIGKFNITVPAISKYTGSPYSLYSDVFIWFGNESETFSDYIFKGKLETIKTVYDVKEGWIKEFSGRDYGEILTREQITKVWRNPQTALSISGSATQEHIHVENTTAFSNGDPIIIKDDLGSDECFISGSASGDQYNLTGSNGLAYALNNNYYQSRNTIVFKKQISWSNIISDLVDDLNLGIAEIETDANYTPIYEAIDKKYFTIIKEICNLRGMDFYTTTGSALKTFTRQSIVNSTILQKGVNILSYNFVDDLPPVANDITIYGAKISAMPSDYDSPSESVSGWGSYTGSVLLEAGGVGPPYPKYGTYSIQLSYGAGNYADSYYTGSANDGFRIDGNDYTKLMFWIYSQDNSLWAMSGYHVALWAPDAANRFTGSIPTPDISWTFNSFNLGADYTRGYLRSTATNSTATWGIMGNPDWRDIRAVEFRVTNASGVTYVDLGPFFYGGRLKATTGSISSQTSYGIRTYKETDDSLYSYWQCMDRAISRLNELKNPVTQFEVTIKGNTSIKAGERVKIISDQDSIDSYYDVLEVETSFGREGYITKLTLNNQLYSRALSPLTNFSVSNAIHERATEKALKGVYVVGPSPHVY